MSGGISAGALLTAGTAAAATAATVYAANQQKQGQKAVARAQTQAADLAAETAKNAPKQQAASTPTLSDAAAGVGNVGASTLLTGNEGVDPTKLALGRNTLLGSNSLLGG